MEPNEEWTSAAARLVVDEGLEYGRAKIKAARQLGLSRGRAMPSNEDIEDAVREHLKLFAADTHPAELRELRELALTWMERFEAFRPHLSGAVWRGTATRRHDIWIGLFCDDPKSPEIELINRGLDYDVGERPGAPGQAHPVLTIHQRIDAWKMHLPIHLVIHDHDELRGALRADARGMAPRGPLAAVRALLRETGGCAA